MAERFFVTGIGTNVGKTMVSAILTEALKADYAKPVQCGNLDYTDEDFVREHLFNSKSVVHEGVFKFRLAASPHYAAMAEGKELRLNQIKLPETKNHLIVEGAGGLMVPLNNRKEYVIDIATKHKLKTILVTDYYLGSINHTLLSLYYMKKNKISPVLIVFNGDKIETTKKAILTEAGDVPYIEIDRFEVNPDNIKERADLLSATLEKQLLHRELEIQ